jgi:UDP-N-acetylglucosamine 1-carboxyvinyltransferase
MKLIIQGGKHLAGEVTLSGAKNATSKMMVASLLTDEECIFSNVPEIGEVDLTAKLCEGLGAKISRSGKILHIQTSTIKNLESVVTQSRKNRIPILTMGPLLARCGEAEVPLLGGDKLGTRPVDLHIKALEAMGAVIEHGEESYRATAPKGLHGADITFDFPSVGATENAMLAAVLADGKTVIRNAAREPEVKELLRLLQKMGAIIELGANREIYIEGVKKLHGAEHAVMSDRNEAASFASLALASGSEIFVRGAIQDQLVAYLNAVRRVGGDYTVQEDGIIFRRLNGLKAIEIETETHPGFMTDWQQPFAVVLTQAQGKSIIHETIYENRFAYAKDLNAMGADISISDECLLSPPCRFADKSFMHSAAINGPTKLHGAELEVRDLRSGIVDIIAALIAEGESVISGIEEIDRGYEKIDERLRALGADIKRVQ